MKKNKINFDDGSFVVWEDKETLRYTDCNYSALIWVDFEPGIFSSGRIIKASSIENWEEHPENTDSKISENIKKKIIENIKEYYRQNKIKCTVEE